MTSCARTDERGCVVGLSIPRGGQSWTRTRSARYQRRIARRAGGRLKVKRAGRTSGTGCGGAGGHDGVILSGDRVPRGEGPARIFVERVNNLNKSRSGAPICVLQHDGVVDQDLGTRFGTRDWRWRRISRAQGARAEPFGAAPPNGAAAPLIPDIPGGPSMWVYGVHGIGGDDLVPSIADYVFAVDGMRRDVDDRRALLTRGGWGRARLRGPSTEHILSGPGAEFFFPDPLAPAPVLVVRSTDGGRRSAAVRGGGGTSINEHEFLFRRTASRRGRWDAAGGV